MENGNEYWLKVRTRGNASPQGKSKVYFTCHPEDFEKYFDAVCEQIFRTHDCAIYYTEEVSAACSDENRETDLGQMNLFVMPVTFKLLRGGNRAMEADLPFAQEKHIPILPLMMESGLTELFTERFGKLQYLNPNSRDETAISYEEKLKGFLDGTLIGSELRRRVQDAFDAYIFLSYRKKDRKYANELMRLIHKNPLYRDIAIWYDEFLTPGEVYSDNIEAALAKSSLFALLVTPNLLEDPNYVMTTEYPKALEQEKKILPVEMDDTPADEMAEKYRALPVMVRGSDDPAFRERLMKELEGIALEANDEDPAHNFLIGLAYLEGIDVEKNNERAVELITMAAEAELPEAMEKLAGMYHDGLAVERDWKKWVEWLEKNVAWAEKEYGEDEYQIAARKDKLAFGYLDIGRLSAARDLYEEIYDVCKRGLGEEDPATLTLLNNMAGSYSGLGEHRRALEMYEKVYELRKRVLGEEHLGTLSTLSDMALRYVDLGEYRRALEMYEKVYELQKKVLGEEHPDVLTTLNNMAGSYSELGEHRRALEIYERAYELRKRILGEDDPATLTILNNMAGSYGDLGEHRRALEIYEKVYKMRKRVLGEEHPDVLRTLNNMAYSYGELGERGRALEIYEKVYESRKRVLGEEHPSTLTTLNNMAISYGDLGEHRRSLEMKEKVYESRKRVLGEEHPSTLTTLNTMAFSYEELGDHRRALEMYEKVYESRKRVLGEEHPSTLTTLNNMACSYDDLGDHRRALEMKEKVYEVQKRVLGEGHPSTLTTLNNMASSYGDLGECGRALEIYEKVYESRKRVLGEEHPDTIMTLNDLAWTHMKSGEMNRAAELFRKALDGWIRVYGDSHPETTYTSSWLAYCYNTLGDSEKALVLCDEICSLPEARLREAAAERIAAIYEQHGQPGKAAEIRKRIE